MKEEIATKQVVKVLAGRAEIGASEQNSEQDLSTGLVSSLEFLASAPKDTGASVGATLDGLQGKTEADESKTWEALKPDQDKTQHR